MCVILRFQKLKYNFITGIVKISRGQIKFVPTKGRPEGITKGFRRDIVENASQTKSNVILNQIVKTRAAKTSSMINLSVTKLKLGCLGLKCKCSLQC